MTDPVETVAAAIGSSYGMTASKLLQHIAIGDVPHPDAKPGECGATDPRFDDLWCVLESGHQGDHANRLRFPPTEGDTQ